MKLIEIVNGYTALKQLSNTKFSTFAKTRAIALLFKQVDSEYKMYSKAQLDLIKEYAKVDDNGNLMRNQNGNIILKSGADKIKFDSEMNDINETDIKVDAVTLSEVDFNNTNDLPTPNDMVLLEGLINWE